MPFHCEKLYFTSHISKTLRSSNHTSSMRSGFSIVIINTSLLSIGIGKSLAFSTIARPKYAQIQNSPRNQMCTRTSLGSTVIEEPTLSQWTTNAIDYIDDIHWHSSRKSPFAIEPEHQTDEDKSACIPFEWVEGCTSLEECSSERKQVAIRTVGGEPLMDKKTISKIRKAAQSKWEGEKTQSSRFTLQFSETNSECHLDDLVNLESTGSLKGIIDTLLTEKIYPTVRSAFGKELGNGRICVYDSLVVRYDGDKAKDNFSASQPLHRDGGIVSVNIALNSHEVDGNTGENGFEGGGTFFEDLINNDAIDKPIVRPSAPGHAVAHLSTMRHAGTPTTSGVREILVLFLTTRQDGEIPSRAPPAERAFHLKINARTHGIPRQNALKCFDVAIEEKPDDGEAHCLKGLELMRNPIRDASLECRWKELNESLYHLSRARELAPFDARINLFTGMAKKSRLNFALKVGKDKYHLDEKEELEAAMKHIEDAITLHDIYQKFGISSDFDSFSPTAIFSLAEVLAQMHQYKDAITCLGQIESKFKFVDDETKRRFIKQKNALVDHCEDMLN
jgi:tetratricopeptide (TPR) repeat protein